MVTLSCAAFFRIHYPFNNTGHAGSRTGARQEQPFRCKRFFHDDIVHGQIGNCCHGGFDRRPHWTALYLYNQRRPGSAGHSLYLNAAEGGEGRYNLILDLCCQKRENTKIFFNKGLDKGFLPNAKTRMHFLWRAC